MKVGIDSYCFHRYFGEIYEGLQTDPGVRWRMEEGFLDYALAQEIDEVALESCFFDALDDGLCAEIKGRLDDAGLDRVLGWGHPEGLWGGTKPEELEQLKRHIPQTVKLGSTRMRICAASMNYANAPRDEMFARVIPQLKEAASVAGEHGVTLALENHIDFTSKEMVHILEAVGSDYLRVNFDTGNAIRLFEDPVEAAERLAPYTVSTHTKDIATRVKGGSPADNFTWWPSCPAGEGVIDLPGVVDALHKGGFDGCLGLEIDLVGEQWVSQTEEEIVAKSIAYLRSIVPAAGTAV
ncbi:sugar phosphate isomerase/epimerase family protein [Kribbella sp. NPDC050820]|uniref:sugar phosphate isomerase/epimerase family protein n=1 Tax=Kribbella sp. NPDC050820 TaxID=3155408 RepID=UPI0033C864D9